LKDSKPGPLDKGKRTGGTEKSAMILVEKILREVNDSRKKPSGKGIARD